jgi:hypothetical protein
MNKDPQKTLRKLIGKYNRGMASSEEATFLDKYYSYFDREPRISDSLSQKEKESIENKMLERVRAKIGNSSINSNFPFYL